MNQKRQLDHPGRLLVVIRASKSIFSALPQMSLGSARKLFDTGLVAVDAVQAPDDVLDAQGWVELDACGRSSLRSA
jgi:hypothetical protein